MAVVSLAAAPRALLLVLAGAASKVSFTASSGGVASVLAPKSIFCKLLSCASFF